MCSLSLILYVHILTIFWQLAIIRHHVNLLRKATLHIVEFHNIVRHFGNHLRHNLQLFITRVNKMDNLMLLSQPRTLKAVKASQYSISFEILQQTRVFNGIDTCSAISFEQWLKYRLIFSDFIDVSLQMLFMQTNLICFIEDSKKTNSKIFFREVSSTTDNVEVVPRYSEKQVRWGM